MTARYLATVSGTRTELWRPITKGVPIILLGNADWTDSTSKRAIPAALADRGYWVAAVDVPNWGNSTDLATIDSTFTWLGSTHGLDTTRVVIVAFSAGGLAAVNWALRHHDRVAALELVAPIVDGAEHFNRVTADQASMNTAFGGNYLTNSTALDPGRASRLHQWLFLGGDRTTVWSHPGDTVTPASVTSAIVTKWTAKAQTLPTVDPLSVPAVSLAADAKTTDSAWVHREAAVQQRRWFTLAQSAQFPIQASPDTTPFYVAGDRRPVDLEEGRIAWLCSDLVVLTAALGVDDTYTGIPFRNGLIVESATGVFTMPVGRSSPGWLIVDTGTYPNPTGISSQHYWPTAGLMDGGNLIVGAERVGTRTTPAPNALDGVLLDHHLHTVNPATFAVTATAPLNITGPDGFWPAEFLRDGAWIYIYAGAYDPPFSLPVGQTPSDYFLIDDGAVGSMAYLAGDNTRRKLARVPVGRLATPTAWEYWTGDGWSSNRSNADVMRDTAGAAIRGDSSVVRTRRGFLMVAKQLVSGALDLYVSGFPWGLWRRYGSVPVPGSGKPRYTGDITGLVTLWQEWAPHIAGPLNTSMATLQYQTAAGFQAGASVLIPNPFFACPLPSPT